MPANTEVYRKNLNGLPGPLIVPGKVQAGSTQAIKRGELCTWNETSGYFIPISAAADAATYLLAFANEEIDAENTPAARYAEFIAPRWDDLFEIPLAAAASLTIGLNYVPTGTNSQTATADVDGLPVFTQAGWSNYPPLHKNGGTTVSSMANGLFTVNYEYSYIKTIIKLPGELKKVFDIATATTLLAEWSGAVITCSSAAVINLPQNCPIGTNFKFVVKAAANMDVVSAGGGIIIKGGVQADNKYIRMADEGDFMELVHIGSNDWVAVNSISGADGDITVES